MKSLPGSPGMRHGLTVIARCEVMFSFARSGYSRVNGIQGISGVLIKHIHEAVAEPVPVAIAVRILLNALADRVPVLDDRIGHAFLICVCLAGLRIYLVDIAEGRQRIHDFSTPLGQRAGKMTHFRYLGLPEPCNQIVQFLLPIIGRGGPIVVIYSFLEIPGFLKLRADFQELIKKLVIVNLIFEMAVVSLLTIWFK